MANNEDVNQANQGAPAADIPDLKKKEKERKKAGAAWSGARPGGGAFSGATGGAGGSVARAAASAASSAGGAAAGAAQSAGAAGWLSTMIARLTATAFGKVALAMGAAMIMAGAGLVGYSFLNGGAAGGGAIGDLGALSSSMKIRAGGGDRTGYVASNGEIRFDPIKAAQAKKAEAEKAPEDNTADAAVPPEQTADAAGKGDWNRPGLEHNLSGSKLSSSLGGGFGGKNIFAGNSAAPKLNADLGKVNIPGAQKGRLSAPRRAATARVSRGGKARQMKANKAFGQLKVAKGMSALGAGTSAAEGAHSTASNAFDGGAGNGNVEGAPGMPEGAVDSPSSPNGAPDMTAPNVDTPDASYMDQANAAALAGIAKMAKAAGEMKKKAAQMRVMGYVLIAVGIALIAAGCTIWTAWCIPLGIMIAGVGYMLVDMAATMDKQADMMKSQAESMSQGLAARTSDTKQNEINQYCIDRAYEGTDPANCNPPDSVTENEQTIRNDNDAVEAHKEMVKETGRVEGPNGKPME